MEVVILPTERELGSLGADIIERHAHAGGTIGLATGSSPLPVYRELIARHSQGLSFASCKAFLLDEYVGLPRAHTQSYYSVIRNEFTERVDFAEVNSPDGEATDIPAEAARYDESIATAGGIDVQLLGIGSDGHVGFNEPGSSLTSRTRVKTLTEQTRNDNARFFDSAEDVPHHVLTQGLGTIGEAGQLILLAAGSHKAAAVAAAVEGPLSAYCPASILQWHPRATVIIDEAAAADLKLADYYRYAVTHKPAWQPF